MSLKAGRVGVAPSQVDAFGNIIGGGGGDAYTKAQSDAKYVNKNQLKANNENFYFAYDNSTGKYGYKLGVSGDFHPFSSATSKYLLPLTENYETLTPASGIHFVSGGVETVSSGGWDTTTFSLGFYLDRDASSYNGFTTAGLEHVYGNYEKQFNIVDEDGNTPHMYENPAYMSISTVGNDTHIFGQFEANKIYYVTGCYRHG